MIGLYSHGMHDFVVRELEVGTRVARAEDDEACGLGPLFDLQVEFDAQLHPEKWTRYSKTANTLIQA